MDWVLQNAIVQDVVTLFKPALFNVYFALLAIPASFPIAIALALAKSSKVKLLSLLSRSYIYALRGSPLFIQLFMVYSLVLALNQDYWKPLGIDHIVLNPLFLGPFVLALNSSAYSAEIFYGAIRTVPKEQIEAAKSVGLNELQRFRAVVWPNMIRLGWPAYTNEVVYLFHATALVYFVLPVVNEQKDLMNKAGELFETDFNVFLHFSVAAMYFLLISLLILFLSGIVYRRLTIHLHQVKTIRYRPNYLR